MQIPNLLKLLERKRVLVLHLDSEFSDQRNQEIVLELEKYDFEVVLKDSDVPLMETAIGITKTLHGNLTEERICFDEDSKRKGGRNDIEIDKVLVSDYYK
uniref:Uncharacterized protein n=1 Tax=Panagrolaimus sp. JU765 TaxID=591449 RepID=A0AC34R484_9BILA